MLFTLDVFGLSTGLRIISLRGLTSEEVGYYMGNAERELNLLEEVRFEVYPGA